MLRYLCGPVWVSNCNFSSLQWKQAHVLIDSRGMSLTWHCITIHYWSSGCKSSWPGSFKPWKKSFEGFGPSEYQWRSLWVKPKVISSFHRCSACYLVGHNNDFISSGTSWTSLTPPPPPVPFSIICLSLNLWAFVALQHILSKLTMFSQGYMTTQMIRKHSCIRTQKS